MGNPAQAPGACGGMSDLFEPTLAEMVVEAERELALRRRVYPLG